MALPTLAFAFWYLPNGLVWGAIALLCFWAWRRTRARSHLVACAGAGWLAQYYALATFELCLFGSEHYGLAAVVGSVTFGIGFYLGVERLVFHDVRRVALAIRAKFGPKRAPAAPPAPSPLLSKPAATAAPRPSSPTPSSPTPSPSPAVAASSPILPTAAVAERRAPALQAR